MQPLIIAVAVLNSCLLAAVFAAQIKGNTKLVRRLGIVYLLLAVPGAAALILAAACGAALQTVIFLCIFLAYLFIEWLYDYALKLDFRSNWKLLVPYIALYFAANYGFFVMSRSINAVCGFVVLALTILQITLNLLTHRKPSV